MVIKFKEKKASGEGIRIGTRIIRQLSTAFYPNLMRVFEELVANARDAMATVVKVAIDEDMIIIEDNGEGMTKDQLVKFFYISHSDKENQPIKTRGDIKREVIGKFGIGKLTLYRLCKSFEITSWRDGKACRATFDFDELEKKEFIDEFDLSVKNIDFSANSRSGTRLVLSNLRQNVSALQVKRRLQLTMPLTSDFKIIISGPGIAGAIEIRSEDILSGGTIYDIEEENVPRVGKVSGRIVFMKDVPRGTKKNAGVYVKVMGRIVNYDNPDAIIDFKDMTHGLQFERNIQAEIDADCLNDILLTNRSGFMEDNEKYETFKDWVWNKLRDYVENEYQKYQKENINIETKIIPQAAADIIGSSLSKSSDSKEIIESWKRRLPKKDKLRARKNIKKRYNETSNEPSLNLQDILLKIDVADMGESSSEATFDRNEQKVIINSSHPYYLFAKKNGKRWGVLYHSIKAAIIVIALEMSRNLEDFKKLYNEMLSETHEGIKNIKLRKK